VSALLSRVVIIPKSDDCVHHHYDANASVVIADSVCVLNNKMLTLQYSHKHDEIPRLMNDEQSNNQLCPPEIGIYTDSHGSEKLKWGIRG